MISAEQQTILAALDDDYCRIIKDRFAKVSDTTLRYLRSNGVIGSDRYSMYLKTDKSPKLRSISDRGNLEHVNYNFIYFFEER